MRIVKTLLARDEQNILQHNIEFHRSRGVDFFIATDNRSKDNTAEILKQYEREGILHYIREDGENHLQGVWVTRMARLAYCEYGTDWVINNDADEFWWPREGDWHSVLSNVPKTYNVVQAKRFNFVPLDGFKEPFYEAMIYRETSSLNALGRPLPAKACRRGCPYVVVYAGNHRVDMKESIIYEGAIDILHFPLQTYDQFERKIAVGGQAFEKNRVLRKGVGLARRGIYQLYKKGELPEYYRLRSYSPRRVEEELGSGFIVKDVRLAECLRQHYSAGAPGDGLQIGVEKIALPQVTDSGEQSGLGNVEMKLWRAALQRYSRGRWSLFKFRKVLRPAVRYALRSLISQGRQQINRLCKYRH